MTKDYQKFFELRDKYPDCKKLVSKLMVTYFENNDSFPEMILIEGIFKQKDIESILNELNISFKDSSNCRNVHDDGKKNTHTRIWFQ